MTFGIKSVILAILLKKEFDSERVYSEKYLKPISK